MEDGRSNWTWWRRNPLIWRLMETLHSYLPRADTQSCLYFVVGVLGRLLKLERLKERGSWGRWWAWYVPRRRWISKSHCSQAFWLKCMDKGASLNYSLTRYLLNEKNIGISFWWFKLIFLTWLSVIQFKLRACNNLWSNGKTTWKTSFIYCLQYVWLAKL